MHKNQRRESVDQPANTRMSFGRDIPGIAAIS
jgi:hypothetical protein